MAKAECLQGKIGSCLGCDILEMAVDRVNRGEKLEIAVQQIKNRYCPDGATPQICLIKTKRAGGLAPRESSRLEIKR